MPTKNQKTSRSRTYEARVRERGHPEATLGEYVAAGRPGAGEVRERDYPDATSLNAVAYPTDAKERERNRKRRFKEQGVERKADEKLKLIKDRHGDCGDCADSLDYATGCAEASFDD